MSSETAGVTVATQKRNNPAKYWEFFTKEDSTFWNFVGWQPRGPEATGITIAAIKAASKNATFHPIEWWSVAAAH